MADNLDPDVLGHPDEAPGTENLRQMLKVDSPVIDDSASDEVEDTSGVEDTTKPNNLEELETLKKRHGDVTRYAQEEARKRKELEARFNKWKDSGIDPDEIDRMIEADTSSNQNNGMDTKNLVSKDELKNVVTGMNWNMARRDFTDANPDFKDENMGLALDFATGLVIQEERRVNGGLISSSPTQLLNAAAKKARAFTSQFEERGRKSVTEKRKKISDTAITEGKDKKKALDEEEETPYDSRKAYVKQRNERFDSFQ